MDTSSSAVELLNQDGHNDLYSNQGYLHIISYAGEGLSIGQMLTLTGCTDQTLMAVTLCYWQMQHMRIQVGGCYEDV